ncbi:MAG TPA: FecR domain-containing protein [Brevundimonas sp.]|nr:FecR domain-containing protein [Brevundimonas sp.]
MALASAALSWPGMVTAQARPETVVDYTMRPGDTLSKLGETWFRRPGDYLRVQRFNRVVRDRRIPVGRVIRIPVDVLRTEPAEGRVANFRGMVTVGWRGPPATPAVGDPVGEGAVIVTGPNAFVRIGLPDGGFVSLPSNSRVRVERLRTVLLTGATDQSFRIEAGRTETRAAPVRPGGGFEVITPVSVAAVRGTEFRSAWFPDTASAATSVVEGAVAVGSGVGEAIAEAGEGIAVARGTVRVLPLLPPAELADGDLTQIRETVAFDPADVAGAAHSRARLAADAGMIDVFAEQDSGPDGVVRFEAVPDGDYFVRVLPVSPEGLEGTAATYAFLRARVGVGGLATSSTGRGRDRAFLFRWEAEGAGPAEYRFQFRAGDEGEERPPLFDLAGLSEPRISLTGLAPGVYEWRVRITRHIAGRRVDVWSEPQQLRIGR